LLAALEEPTRDKPITVRPSAAASVLNARPRVRPLSRGRVWTQRLAAASLLVVLFGGAAFFTDDSYPAVARALDLPSATFVAPGSGAVGLVIQASPELLQLTVAELAKYGDRATFAYRGGWSSDAVLALERSGNEVLPTLGSGSFTGWFHTRRTLAAQAASLGASTLAVYLPPREGFTLGQYLLAHEKGALPLEGAVTLDSARSMKRFVAKEGELVVVVLNSDSSESPVRLLDQILGELQAKGLVAVPLGGTSVG
jgi:hypothetical protein